MIAIIDYGAGNLRSVKKAFDYIHAHCRVVSRAGDLKKGDRVVLPGVGAFGAAMEKLKARGFVPVLKEFLGTGGSFLGICLGMQLLLESSEESDSVDGLAVFRGKCHRFEQGKVPQIGWNQVEIAHRSPLLEGIAQKAYFYFIHGYYVSTPVQELVMGRTTYHIGYASVIGASRIFAVQFHPEKSGGNGLKLLKNWVEKC